MANRTMAQYKELIPAPNQGKDRFMRWVEALLTPHVNTQEALNSLVDAFNIDKAVGVQLDYIGELLGRPRQVDFTMQGGASGVLGDDLYRKVIKAKILLNTWKGTVPEIYAFWDVVFPDSPINISNNEDMTIDFTIFNFPEDFTSTTTFAYTDTTYPDGQGGYGTGHWGGFIAPNRQLVSNHYFTPKPAGVTPSYAFTDASVFGYGAETDFIKGYGTGEWIAPV